jgi:hypothetical protein
MFPVSHAFSGGNRAYGRGGPPGGRELVDLQKREAGTSQAPPESRRSLAVVPLIPDQRYYGETPAKLRRCSGDAPGRIWAGTREWAARMARAAERVAWVPREPSWAPKAHRDAENRRAALCRCSGDAGAGHFWDISPAVNVLAGANPDGRPGLRYAMPGNVELGDVAVGARTGARPCRDGC